MSEEKSLVCEQLEKQHPVHGALGRAYDLLGGDNLFYDWGLENPGGLLKMVMATTPSMQPVTSIAGDVILQVHPTLAPTALDGERVPTSWIIQGRRTQGVSELLNR